MKKHFQTVAFVAVLIVAPVLSAWPSAAADRVPGPEVATGALGSTSGRADYRADYRANYEANYRANYYADYRVNGTEDRINGTEESPSRRDGQRDFQPEFHNPLSVDRYGRLQWGAPR
jgi:hypothetical protein